MSRPNNSFTSLAGAPTHYAREPIAPYGTKGAPHRFHATDECEAKLTAAFNELWALAPDGRAEVLTSAVAYVEKPGCHGLGRAFDLDAIFWSGREFVTLSYPTNKRFYLGVEAVMRKHFGTVLNHLYNAAHRDHLHLDDGTAVGFNRTSRARVLFLQAALTHVLDIPVGIDGVYGDETDGAVAIAFEQLGIGGPIDNREDWLQF